MRIESNDANVGVGTTSDMKVELDTDTLKKVMKDYKRIKKYMRSSIYEVKKMDGNEKVITKLMKELENI
jgi:hypothetical protein